MKKSVRFPEDESDLASQVVEIENRLDISEDERKILWFTRSDCHFCRSSARVISKEAERYGYSKNLDRVYVTAANDVVQAKLNMWVLHGHSRRGLERWANMSHGQARKEDQFIYLKGIINAQEDLRVRSQAEKAAAEEEASKGGSTTAAPPRRDDAERLRQVGHVLSRKARLFAQMMGAADQHAVQCEYGMVDAATKGMASMGIASSVTMPPPSSRFVGAPPRASAHMRRSLGLSGMPGAAAAALAGGQPTTNRINLNLPQQQQHGIIPGIQQNDISAQAAIGHMQALPSPPPPPPTAASSPVAVAPGFGLDSTKPNNVAQQQRRPSRSGRVPRVA